MTHNRFDEKGLLLCPKIQCRKKSGM